ncbi:magnesium-dependent phosphatase 1 [Aplysia californica]|uniref:Magnesium-dependent phosphatase 1 n=1 Tax=Aplysia californica TaxID=6500 RepID=A0ABM0JDL0_APLCA|nr:magnesium-dependent phosphatase 1 [Aplysia californica]XP_005091248.1 magnesium-dependent phosphatase 1 [Aplysia californica]XP_035829184.1 magnesium-dependent phosphatase 1 [Aplysia californica]XP_035829188.1 magnesium-dependent phosphatase 1 [Aplysia californica]
MIQKLLVTITQRRTRCCTFCSLLTYQRHISKLSTMAQPQPQPKLIVFDLDYTLWPFWVDTHVSPPFKMGSNGKVYDADKQHVKYYPDVPDILRKLHQEDFKLGIASRTSATHEANDLTRLFNWDQFFHYRQIYPGCKITHFKKLHNQSGIPYEDMIFFDDEHRNIVDVSSLGVTCMFVPDGVSWQSFKEGIELFQRRRTKKGTSS